MSGTNGNGNGIEAGSGQDTTGPQPLDATLTTPWPAPSALMQAIFLEIQTRYRLLAMDNMRPQITGDEMAAAIYDGIDRLNSFPPATNFTLPQLFATDGDPRFRGVFYVCVAEKLCVTLLADWSANSFSQNFNNFSIESKLADYQQLLTVLTEQVESQLEKLKASTQKYVLRVAPRHQSLINPFPGYYRRPLGSTSGGCW